MSILPRAELEDEAIARALALARSPVADQLDYCGAGRIVQTPPGAAIAEVDVAAGHAAGRRRQSDRGGSL